MIVAHAGPPFGQHHLGSCPLWGVFPLLQAHLFASGKHDDLSLPLCLPEALCLPGVLYSGQSALLNNATAQAGMLIMFAAAVGLLMGSAGTRQH